MRRLWADVIAPYQAVVLDMYLRGIKVDQEVRKELLGEAKEEWEARADHVRGVAARYTSVAMPPLPRVERCPDHPEYKGATVRRKCQACREVWETLRSWRQSAAVRKANRLASFNPNSKDHVGWLLFDKAALDLTPTEYTDTGRPKVTLAVLEELLGQVEDEQAQLVGALVALAHAQHRISVDLQPPIWADGRAHPWYSIDATTIGRDRSGADRYDLDKADEEGFNFQNIPEPVRRMYVADEGHRLVGSDAAQIEWATMMLRARCMRGLTAYAEARDIHTENASEIVSPLLLGHDWSELDKTQRKKDRGRTKTFTHGLDYKEGIKNLSARFGVSMATARKAKAAYFEKWPEILAWHEEVEELVKRDKMLRTCWGRVRRFLDVTGKRRNGEWIMKVNDKQLHEAVAFEPASMNGDLQKVVRRELYDMGLQLLTATHDDALLQVPEDRAEELRETVKQVCEREVPEMGQLVDMPDWKPRYDVRVGQNWGDWHEHGVSCDDAETCGKVENRDGLQ